MNLDFERYKLTRFIKTHGTLYGFTIQGKNVFGESSPSETPETVEIPGVYHETQGYVTSTATDGSNIKSKPSSLIMCLKEDSISLKRDMVTTIQGKDYKIVDLRDVNNLGVACDISLELVLK